MKKALIVRFLIVIAIVMSVCVVSATALLSSTEQNVRKKRYADFSRTYPCDI